MAVIRLRRKWRKIGFLIGVVMTLGAGACPALDLDSLLVQSVGGPAAVDSVAAMRSYVAKGTMTLNGAKGRFTELYRAPNSTCMQMQFPGFEMVQGFDGETAWRRDHNGQTSTLSGAERSELINGAYYSSFSYLFPDRMPGLREYRGLDTTDGHVFHKVIVCPEGGDTATFLFDIDDSRLIHQRSNLDDMEMLSSYSDHRRVGGIVWPMHQTAQGVNVPVVIEAVYDTVLINEPIDDSVFAIGTERASDFRFPADLTLVTIPMDYHTGHIRVEAVVNGRVKVWFILDSGASANMLDLSLTEELGLEKVGGLPAKGIGGYEEVALVRTDSIAVGSLTLLGQVAGSLDLSQLTSGDLQSTRFGGVLGYDFLSRFPILIDYGQGTLTVFDPETFSAPPGGFEIPFYLTLSVPTVRGEIEGAVGDFIVDLGNPFGLILHSRFVREHGLEARLDDIRDVGSAMTGVGGEVLGQTGRAEAFRLGGVEISDLTVLVARSEGGLAQSEALAGNVGNLILQNFRLLLDYSRGSLYLYDVDR